MQDVQEPGSGGGTQGTRSEERRTRHGRLPADEIRWMAHSLRNALALIASHIELLRLEIGDVPFAAHQLQQIDAAVVQCARVIQRGVALAVRADPDQTIGLEEPVKELINR